MSDEVLRQLRVMEKEIERLKTVETPGLIMLNVRRYGAKGDNVHNDASAINSAGRDARAHGWGLYFPAVAVSYYCADQVDLRGIKKIEMNGPIRTGYAGEGVLAGGDGVLWPFAHLDLNVYRYPYNWTAGYVSLGLRNLRESWIKIRKASGSEVGVRIWADTALNSAYNTYVLGEVGNNDIGLKATRESSGGWINECIYEKGDFTSTVGGETCAVMLDGDMSQHCFIEPCFQVEGVNGVIFNGASNCHVRLARAEGTIDAVAEFNLDPYGTIPAHGNTFELGDFVGATDTPAYTGASSHYDNHVYKAGASLVSILDVTSFEWAYKDTLYNHFPGFGLMKYDTAAIVNKANFACSKTIDGHGVVCSSASYFIGMMVDTTVCKTFYPRHKNVPGLTDPTWFVRCFDAAGAILSGTAPYQVEGLTVAQVYTDAYRITKWPRASLHFVDAVKSAWIGIGYRGVDFYSEGMDILVYSDQYIPAAWPGYTGIHDYPGRLTATASPTAHPFYRGDVVWSDNSASGATPGWACVLRMDTTVNGDEATGQTDITLTSATSIAVNDIIGIVLDTGFYWWSYVTSIAGAPTVTINDALPSQASTGAAVVTNRWKAMANLA